MRAKLLIHVEIGSVVARVQRRQERWNDGVVMERRLPAGRYAAFQAAGKDASGAAGRMPALR
jgi:hypothetical protein